MKKGGRKSILKRIGVVKFISRLKQKEGQGFVRVKVLFKFLLPRIAVSFLAIVLLLPFVELSLRFFVSKQKPSIFRIAGYEEVYDLNPGFEGDFADVFVKINKQGLRQNNEISLNKEKDVTKRIIGIGDSVGFGYGLKEEEIYLRQLETQLNKNSKEKIEIINGSITGYNTFQEREFFKKNLLKLKPDIVIVSFVLNDVAGDFHVPNNVYRTLAPFKDGAYSPNDLSKRESIFYNLFRKTNLYQFFYPHLKSFWGFDNRKQKMIGNYGEGTIFFYKNGYYQEKKYKGSMEKTEDDLLKLSQLAKENNFQLVIVIFPVEVQLQDKTLRKPQEILNGFCSDNQLKCLDLLPFLEKEKEKVFLDLGHPNIYGSEIISKILAKYLKSNKLF